jgi:hypothetical protein
MTWHRFTKDTDLDPLTPVTRVDRYGFRYKWHARTLIDGHVFYLGHGDPPTDPMPDARPAWLRAETVKRKKG